MDDKDFDHSIDVPDTPDRLNARFCSHTSEKECISSRVGCLHNSVSMDRGRQDLLRDEVRVVNRIGPSRRPFIRPPERISNANGSVDCSNTIIISPSDNSCTSQGRRVKIDRSSEHHHVRYLAAHIHAGKALKSSSASEDGVSMRRNACNKVPKPTLPFRESKQFGDKCREAEGEKNRNNSHHHSSNLFARLTNPGKGKEKVDESTCRGNESAMGLGNGIDLLTLNNNNESKSPKRLLEPLHDVSSPRAVRQKRLVRNGCITPHNIAMKSIQLAGENSCGLKNFGPLVRDEVSSSSQCWPEEKELTRDDIGGRNKGKGILHPCSSRNHEARAIDTSIRNPVVTGVEATCEANVNVDDFYESKGDWKSTRNNNMCRSGSVSEAGLYKRGNGTGSSVSTCKDIPERTNRLCDNKRSRYDFPENMEAMRATPRLAPSASTVVRRQTRNGSTSRNDADNDSVVLLYSSEDSPDLSSARHLNPCSNPIIEVDEFSPEMRQSGSARVGSSDRKYLDDARTRQMEADEILARELQEQLYNESPVDEYVAQILQEEQNHVAPTNAIAHRHTSVYRGTSMTRSRRQPQPELHQSLSPFRRRARINSSLRLQQSRRHTSRLSSSLSRERGPQFPSDMDLDMRIDVLEALEAALGDMDDIIEASSNIYQMQRDFNENDYEMLLALDENVHQAGASSRQINNLPESKVQSNTACEETCAICLENPPMGETIRHLPCLHKFHKDCIDPWLSRSTSCPVCKSSIS